MNDNICAIATAVGMGGISIIRLSGSDVIEIVENFLKNKKIKNMKANELYLDYFIVDGEILDQVLVSKFIAPHSFTGENTVEINCHGGIYLTNVILKELIEKSELRLASPGEFSKRAFLNGKLDLVSSQGIIDLIEAHNNISLEMAKKASFGSTTKLIRTLYDELMNIVTKISVKIDYPEYDDIEDVTQGEIYIAINKFIKNIDTILKDSNRGQLFKNGIVTAIVGKPNVGKSTLLNLLAKTERAIVTDIAGTTRDVIEAEVTLGNLKLNLMDTAGIRETKDVVEAIGVKKSYQVLEEAQLIIFIVDSTTELNTLEKELYKLIQQKPYIIINNKNDVGNNKFFDEELSLNFNDYKAIEKIEETIIEKLDLKTFDAANSQYVNQINQIDTLNEISNTLKQSLCTYKEFQLLDMVELDLKEVLSLLGSLIGIEAKTDFLDELFSRYCLGK